MRQGHAKRPGRIEDAIPGEERSAVVGRLHHMFFVAGGVLSREIVELFVRGCGTMLLERTEGEHGRN